MVRYGGYVVYGFLAIIVLGAILPNPPEATTVKEDTSTSSDTNNPSRLSSSSDAAKSSDSSSEVECMDNYDLENVIEESLMQMGYFKSVHMIIEDKVAELTVEPSAQGYQEASSMKHLCFSSIKVIDQYSPCLRDKLINVGIVIVGPEYNVLLTFPYSASLDGTSEQVYKSEIIQK